MKHLINRLYGITQKGDIYRKNSVKLIESGCRWLKNIWTRTERQGIFEIESVESDCRRTYVVNEISDW